MPSLALGLLMFVAAAIGLFGWPFCAMMIYVWLDHTAPQPQLWGPLSSLPYSQVIGAAALIGWLIHTRDKFRVMNPLFFLIGTYAVWVSVTTIFALAPEGALWKWDRTMKVLLSSMLVGLMLTTKERFAGFLWTIVIAVGVYIARGGIRTLATGGGGLLVVGLDGTFVGERNTFAATVAGVLPMIYALIRFPVLFPSNRLVKLTLWGLFSLGVVAILGSSSRSGTLALVLVLALLIWSFSKFRIAMFVAATALSIAAIPFLPDETIQRVGSIGEYQEDGSSTNRINAWKFGTNIALASPIVGGGFKVYLLNLPSADVKIHDGYIDAHSFFFEILGEHGFVGIGLFMFIWGFAAKTCMSLRKSTNVNSDTADESWYQVYARCLLIGLCGYSLGGLFNALGSYAYFYLVFASIGSLAVLARLESKDGLVNEKKRAKLALNISSRKQTRFS